MSYTASNTERDDMLKFVAVYNPLLPQYSLDLDASKKGDYIETLEKFTSWDENKFKQQMLNNKNYNNYTYLFTKGILIKDFAPEKVAAICAAAIAKIQSEMTGGARKGGKLENMTVKELRARATRRKIAIPAGTNKAGIIRLLRKK